MSFNVTTTDGACGATVQGLDLTGPLDSSMVAQIRRTWLEHHVLVFPEQKMSDDDLERFTTYFGNFGDDPYLPPIEGRDHIVAVSRGADEKTSLFAESWHSDWSFQVVPPAGTCLMSIIIPPMGGDTCFTNQHKALVQMPGELRARIEGKIGLHSAASAYAPDGFYGEQDKDSDRSMDIIFSESAYEVQEHPLIRNHPETAEEGLFGCVGYIFGIKGMAAEESRQLLIDLHHWQTREEFQYQHKWSECMLVMWDNRSVLHKAIGGYEGHARLLHRTTIADNSALDAH